MPKLSTQINLKFVQLYRDHECLWNPYFPGYKEKCKRDSALQKIRDELKTMGIDMSTKDIKSKIKNLRATYSQELTKIDKSTRSGAGSQEEYKSKLNWFQEMHSFIKNVPMKRKTTVSYLQSFIYYYLRPIYCPSVYLTVRLKCKIDVNYDPFFNPNLK